MIVTALMEQIPVSHITAGLALALTFGGMTFFSGILAPLVFTKLPIETAGAFIRALFPWYYLSMGTTTLLALAALASRAGGIASWETGLTGLVLLGFVYVRQSLMPRINRARDAELAGDSEAGARFTRLHRLSVLINGLQWFAVLAALVLVLS